MKQITNTQLAKLAAQGYGAEEIAESLGVTTSAISQALQIPEVQYLLEKEKSQSQAAALDNRYDNLEDKVLGLLEKRIPFEGQNMKMRELVQVVQVMNNMKRRTGGSQGEGNVQTVVNLTIPIQLISRVVMSSTSDIVEIDGRTMTTVEPKAVNLLLEARDATRPKQISDLL